MLDERRAINGPGGLPRLFRLPGRAMGNLGLPLLIASGMVALATAVRLEYLGILGNRAPYLMFYPAVMIAGLVGGLRAGLLATVLSGVAAAYFWIEPVGHVLSMPNPADRVSMAIFLGSCGLVSVICEVMRRAQSRARAAEAGILRERSLLDTLEAEHRKLEAAFENLPIGIAICDPHGHFVAMNPACLRMHGFASHEAMLAHLDQYAQEWEVRSPEGRTIPLEDWPVPRAARGDYVQGYELILHHLPTGQGRFCECSISPVRDDDGRVFRLVICLRDITERRQAEAALRSSQAKLESALASMTDAVFISDAQGHFINFNDAFATYHRFKDKGQCARTFAEYPDILEVFLPDGTLAPISQWAVPRALRGETAVNAEYTLRRKDTGETWVGNYSFAPILDADGAIVGSVVTARDVTAFKRADEALRESERRLALIIDAARLGTYDWDLVTNRIVWNQRHAELFETTLETFDGSYDAFASRVHPEDLPRLNEAVERSRRERSQYDEEFRVLRPDGGVRWILGSGRFYYDDRTGEPVRMSGVISDITDRKQAEESQLANAQRLSLAIEAANAGSWEWDLATGENTWSAELWSLYGIAPHSCRPSYDGWRNTVHPGDLPHIEEAITSAVRTGAELKIEWRVRLADGVERWLMSRGRPVFGRDGKAVRYLGIVIDITDRKQAEAEQQRLAEERQLALDAARLGWWRYDPVKEIATSDRRYGEILGATSDAESVERILARLHPEDVPAVRRAMAAALDPDDPQPFFAEYRVPREDGSLRIVEAHGIATFEGEGRDKRAASMVGTVQDITERRRAERALFETNQRLQALMNALPVGVSFSDDTTCLRIHGNPAVLTQFSFNDSENLSASAREPDAPGRRVQYYRDGSLLPDHDLPLQRAVAENRSIPPEVLEIELPDGRRWFCEACGAPVRDADGRVMGAVAVTVDITARRLAEATREHLLAQLKEKTSELEALLYASSHDLRSPLVNIQGFSLRLGQAVGQLAGLFEEAVDVAALREAVMPLVRERIPESLRYISASAEKMDQLLTGLLRLSRLGRIELIPARIDMNRLVPSILAALKHQAEQAQATIEVEDLPACRADAAQVNQMLTNFLDNALKYRHPDRLPSIRISGRVDGDAAIYCVEDNGPGIEPEHQDKIWGLFSRLEPRGPVPGEGLGLAAVRQMVWRNGGRAWVESAPGQGSRFFLSLPRAAESDGLDGPNGS